MNFLRKVRAFLAEAEFEEKSKSNQYNYLALAIVAGIGHIFFGIYWRYIDPLIFQGIGLRVFGMFTCVALVMVVSFELERNKICKFVWIFSITYNLPFFFTVMLMRNDFDQVWFTAQATMIMVVILFLTNLLKSLLTVLLGVFLAIIYCYILAPDTLYIHQEIITHFPIYVLTIVAGYIFSLSNNKGYSVSREIKEKQKVMVVTSLAGSIAHEIRNPLNTINLVGAQIDELLIKEEDMEIKGKVSYEEHAKNRQELLRLTASISESIYSANNIINIILSDLKEKKVDPQDFIYINPITILLEIKDKYGYRTEAERVKVKFDKSLQKAIDKNDNKYIFKAVEDRFVFIVFNLLKNSLFYLNEYPKSMVTIGVGYKVVENIKYNSIFIHDTGPGIPKEAIPKLFEDFYTSGKKDGTGLGLAFCKRNMLAFGGDIICESEVGKWTRFSLLFPVITPEELKKAGAAERRKKILIVDDQKTNLVITKYKIEKNLSFSCDMAENGSDAISLIKANKYQLVLMDIQMPEMNGIEATNKIKAINKDIPVVGLSSLQHEDIKSKIECFSYYLNKPVAGHILHRTISKITMHEDDGSYLGDRTQYLPELAGKNVLFADDQEINRKITIKKLETIGMKVTEVANGKDLVDKYRKSLKKDKSSKFDIILTDINMPPFNGDDASKIIRSIEEKNKILYTEKMPIIALTGDGQKEDIDHFFECDMTDYYIKGQDPELLIKLIAIYVTPEKIYYNKKQGESAAAKETSSEKGPGARKEAVMVLNTEKLRYFGEDDKKDFLDTFLKDSDEMISKISRNVQENNLKEMSLALHAFKGICGNIGAEELSIHIKKIEATVKENKLPSDKNWLENLQKSYKKLEIEIKKIL